MGKRLTVAETSLLTGLSKSQLKAGANANIYPCIRVGVSQKKLLFDIDLLEDALTKLAASNVKPRVEAAADKPKARRA